jgi:hypothetical protein
MSLIDWMKHWVNLPTPDDDLPIISRPADADKHAEIAGLNFMGAIDAHMKWKTRLGAYIQGTSNEDLKVDAVSRDDQCPLGKWIYGAGGQRYDTVETFAEVKRYHADFHRCAGKVLSAAKSGQRDEAMDLLYHGDYLRNSERVKMLLAKLFVELHEKRKLEA